jgi:pimeloyl-ACP methyl ester carboxylesterase
MHFFSSCWQQPKHLVFAFLCVAANGVSPAVSGGVVTVIAHGFSSDAYGWVRKLGEAVSTYPRLRGVAEADAVYLLSWDSQGYPRIERTIQANEGFERSTTGNITVLVDWNPYSGSVFSAEDVSTRLIGPSLASALTALNFIPGHRSPLARRPLHLIGHSRGASLVCETAKALGERNIAVDHLSLLDAHPLNQDGFSDILGGSSVDGTCKHGIYENVLFADSVYQEIAWPFPLGIKCVGAFNRRLDYLDQGYSNQHSDPHLWYYGTVRQNFPTTYYEGEIQINMSMRNSWFTPDETLGIRAGYFYSLQGGASRRFGVAWPFGPTPPNTGSDRVADGLNRLWHQVLDIRSGDNRTRLSFKNDPWANPLELNVKGGHAQHAITNNAPYAPIDLVAVEPFTARNISLSLAWSCADNTGCTASFFLDPDANSENGIILIHEERLGSTFHLSPSLRTFDIAGRIPDIAPGLYRVGVLLAAQAGTRELYSQQHLVILPPVELSMPADGGLRVAGPLGARFRLEASSDTQNWNVISEGSLDLKLDELTGESRYTIQQQAGQPAMFFKATAFLD